MENNKRLTVVYVGGLSPEKETAEKLAGKSIAYRNAVYFKPSELEKASSVAIEGTVGDEKAKLIKQAYEGKVKVVSIADLASGKATPEPKKEAFNPDAPVKEAGKGTGGK